MLLRKSVAKRLALRRFVCSLGNEKAVQPRRSAAVQLCGGHAGGPPAASLQPSPSATSQIKCLSASLCTCLPLCARRGRGGAGPETRTGTRRALPALPALRSPKIKGPIALARPARPRLLTKDWTLVERVSLIR